MLDFETLKFLSMIIIQYLRFTHHAVSTSYFLEIKIRTTYFCCFRYVAPLSIMAYLYVKASRELQNVEEPLAIGILDPSRHENNADNDIT